MQSSDARSIASSKYGLADTPAVPGQRRAALIVCGALALAAALAAIFGLAPGPTIRPFVPITATVWALADLLTAFLLLTQFYVTGKTLFAVLASAYAFSGFLTWPYVAAFPGAFNTHQLDAGEQQISIVLWSTWHCVFPALVSVAAFDSAALRIVSRRRIQTLTVAAAFIPLIVAVTIAALTFRFHAALPHLILAGHFKGLWTMRVVPAIIAINVLTFALLVARPRRLTALTTWLAVAMFSSVLDSTMNLLSTTRYSIAWETGKVITVFTASIVLVMMLSDIVALYGRLELAARIDMLTSLFNRRAFEEHLYLVSHNARRLRTSIALLIVDIDHFKRYNDTFGHLGGDECLRRVALAINECATRPLDLAARYGGEEFTVVLPNTDLAGVLVVAERIRAAVEQLEIVHDAKAVAGVTVSIGVAFRADAIDLEPTELFESADRALYVAKRGGRNCVVLGENAMELPTMPPSATAPAALAVTVAAD